MSSAPPANSASLPRCPTSPSLALGTPGVSLLELTSAYAAIAGGRYPVAPRGLPLDGQDEGLRASSAAAAALDERRDWAPMLDLLWAAANKGTGRRAALAVPTFGKTGTTQDNRDALFIGFAGNLVVGVWVGRDDNNRSARSPAAPPRREIWRSFMVPALAIDGRAGPPLPPASACRRAASQRTEKKSPLPDDWSDGGDATCAIYRGDRAS